MADTSQYQSGRIKVAISACLVGEPVRYDGGHRLERGLVAELAGQFELVPFCPEVGAGMGVPRPPIQLIQTARGIRARGVANADTDVTGRLADYGAEVAKVLVGFGAYVFKARSPSCGVASTPVFDDAGNQISRSAGIYAGVIMAAFPEMPVAEESRLLDSLFRADFIQQVYAYGQRRESGT